MIEWDNVYETLNRMHCSWEAFLKCEVLLLWLLVNEGSRLWFWRVLWNSQPWSAVHLQLASNLVSQNIVGKTFPRPKGNPLSQVSVNSEGRKNTEVRDELSTTSPHPQENGVCVSFARFWTLELTGRQHWITMSPKGENFWVWAPIGTEVLGCLGEREV